MVMVLASILDRRRGFITSRYIQDIVDAMPVPEGHASGHRIHAKRFPRIGILLHIPTTQFTPFRSAC
jgi:hypothetical protein